MLLQLDFLSLDRPAIRGRQAEMTLHGDDAGTHPGHGAGAAQDVDVVAGRLLDDFQGRPVPADQLPDESERAAVEKAPAQGDRRAIGHEGGQTGEWDDLGKGHGDHGSVEEP